MPLYVCYDEIEERQIWGAHGGIRVTHILLRCVSLHRLPFSFVVFMAWQTADGVTLFHATLQPTTSSFANANLSVPSSDVALEDTTGELDHAGTSRSPSLTKELPPPPLYMLHHQGSFHSQRSQTPTAHYRVLIDQSFIHDDASSTTS